MGINFQDFGFTTSSEPAGSLNDVAQESQQETQQQDHVEARSSSPFSSSLEIFVPRHPQKTRRSSCPSPCTLSPDSNHSSETLFSTPRHSRTSSSPIFVDFCRTYDKHEKPGTHCWVLLAEHLKAEEQDAENAEWEMVVEWMRIAHQTEVTDLKAQIFIAETILEARDVDLANEKDDHDADLRELETLKKERSHVRKCLSERNTDLRKAKKEITNLKSSLEGVLEQRSVGKCAEGRGKMEEGAVRLAGTGSSHVTEVRELQEDRKESTPEKPGLSRSQAAAFGEVQEQATLQIALGGADHNKRFAARVKELEKQNETLEENLEYATDEVVRLRLEAKATKEEVKKLRGENHFARLEVGYIHAANAFYRAEREDQNPARTAHIDGYLKRKDEAYAELEMHAAECAEQLAEEKRNREIDNVYAEGKIDNLNKELAVQLGMVAGLTEGRNILVEQKEEIFQMFQKKIFPSDVDEAFSHDYGIIKKDNAFLINMINKRQYYLEDAEKPMADLKAAKLILENAAESDHLKQRQMQQSINGLEVEKLELQDKVTIMAQLRDEAAQESNARIKQQAEEMKRLLRDGAEDGWMRRARAQADEMADCRAETARLQGLMNQWRMRALEAQEDFCPLLRCAEVIDWTAEESRWRLHHAERRAVGLERRAVGLRKQVVHLRRKVRGAGRDGRRAGVV